MEAGVEAQVANNVQNEKVEKVEKVEKFQPPRVVVVLRYREPVARVENNMVSDPEASSHCIVDRDGVLLPLHGAARQTQLLTMRNMS